MCGQHITGRAIHCSGLVRGGCLIHAGLQRIQQTEYLPRLIRRHGDQFFAMNGRVDQLRELFGVLVLDSFFSFARLRRALRFFCEGGGW